MFDGGESLLLAGKSRVSCPTLLEGGWSRGHPRRGAEGNVVCRENGLLTPVGVEGTREEYGRAMVAQFSAGGYPGKRPGYQAKAVPGTGCDNARPGKSHRVTIVPRTQVAR